MNKAKLKSLVMGLAVLTFVACGNKQETKDVDTTDRDHTHVDTTMKEYVCPMNCENSASDEPGKCNVCGMDLEKKK